MTQVMNKSDFRFYAGLIIAFLTGFSINLSTSFQNIMVVLMLCSSLFSPHLNTALKRALKNDFIRGALLFYCAFIIGITWSNAPEGNIIGMLMRMSLFLLCPLIYVYFYDQPNAISFFAGFASCVILSIFLALLSSISGLGFFHPATGIHWQYMGINIDLFRGHSYQNYFAAIVSTGLLMMLAEGYIKGRIQRLLAIGMLIIIFIAILFFVTGRTGQILYALMFGFTALFYMKKIRLKALAVLIALIIPITFYFSPNIRDGIDRGAKDIKNYQSGYANTSLGLRLTFYKNSLYLINQSPVYGHGTGSFRFKYEQLNDPVMHSVANPHNDYLWFTVELGVIGLAVFVVFLGLSLKQTLHTAMPYKLMAFLILATYTLSSINNSFFTDNLTGQFFILCLCALLSNREKMS